MKQKIIVNVLLAAMVAGGASVCAGSSNNGEQPVGDRPCHCAEQGIRQPPPPSPETLVDQMACQLGLTSEQQTKIKALFTQDREKTEPLRRNLVEYHTQLRAAMKSATFNEAAIRAMAAKQAQTDVELTVSKARLRSQINALLTPEQRTLAEKYPPPFPHDHGQQPPCGDGRRPHLKQCKEDGPGHLLPPPPCGDHGGHHPGTDYDGE